MNSYRHGILPKAEGPPWNAGGPDPEGVHTREVLGKLGYTVREIEEFEKTGLFS